MASSEMLSATKMQQRAELEHEDNLATLEHRIELRLGAIAESKRAVMSARSAQMKSDQVSRVSSSSGPARAGAPGMILLPTVEDQWGGDRAGIVTGGDGAAQQTQQQPLGEAESVLIRAKDDAISLWNLAMDAAEALVSVPALATAGMTSGTRALPLPGLQGEREAKKSGSGASDQDFSVPLITQIQKMEREGFYGEPGHLCAFQQKRILMRLRPMALV